MRDYECFGGPLDGERRPYVPGLTQLMVPWQGSTAVYVFKVGRFGQGWQFVEMSR